MNLEMNNWGTFYEIEETMLQDDMEVYCTECGKGLDPLGRCQDCKALA